VSRSAYGPAPTRVHAFFRNVRDPSNKSWDSDKRRRAELVRISRRYGGFWTPTNAVFLADSLEMYVKERLGQSPSARLVRYPVTKLKRLLRRQFRGQFQP
jgi:hypothetical protein